MSDELPLRGLVVRAYHDAARSEEIPVLTRRHDAGPTFQWLRQAESPGGVKVPDSIINRWQGYARAADEARLRHGVLEIASLVVTAAIPACAAFGVEGRWIAVLGAVAVVLNGGRQLFGWKESWANRKKVRYAIEQEIALFRVGAGRYASDDALVRLVETVEETCAEERDNWHSRRLAYDGSTGRQQVGSS